MNKNDGDNVNKIIALQHDDQSHFNSKQIEILKNSICKGVTDDEFEVFLMACAKTQLDPFMKQIYAVKRKSKRADGTWGETMTIQTGIDGYRLLAERTGCYAPGPEPTYGYDNEGRLQSATACIKKQTRDGTWHTISASAYIDEYMQKTRDGQPMGMWANMPRTMLSKCAESQALRKAFPAEMSGIYTKEEMLQADVTPITSKDAYTTRKITSEQAAELDIILSECNSTYKTWVLEYIKKSYGAHTLAELPADIFERVRIAAIKNMEEHHAKDDKDDEETPQLELMAGVQ